MTKLIGGIDNVSEWTGRLVSWLTSALVLLICYDVTMRYIANETAVWFQEMEWHMFSLIFLIGAAYTFRHDKHVRVDVFYSRFSPKTQAWINLIGGLLLLLPFCIIMIKTSYGYAERSFIRMESSDDPGGLPFRFIIKGAITFGFVLLCLQAIAELLRSINSLLGRPVPNSSSLTQPETP